MSSSYCTIRGPSSKGVPFLSAEGWLRAKAVDDAVPDNCWRIHNNIYDLNDFYNSHPGGKFWIEMTKGTDITELYESSHPNIEKANLLLKKYFKCSVNKENKRNTSILTFEPNGFYCTLRKKVWEVLKNNNGTKPTNEICDFHDFLLITFLIYVTTMLIPNFDNHWIAISFLNGVLLSCLCSVAHNFYHHKNNMRIYSWDLTLYSSYEWRISHCYSHHNYPNSILDFEVSVMEPFVYWLPMNKSLLIKATSFLILQLLACFAMFIQFITRFIKILTGTQKLHKENLLPFILFCYLIFIRFISNIIINNQLLNPININNINNMKLILLQMTKDEFMNIIIDSFKIALTRISVMYIFTSWVFHNVSLAAGHHHPDIWHEGDEIPKEIDWGLFQVY